MVYYESGQGKNRKKYGVSVGVGPVKITSANPSLRKQVMNVKKTVKEIQSKEELKYLDTLLNNSTINTTATLTLLNGMTLGDTVSSRDGDSIVPTSIQFRARFSHSQNGLTDLVVRHMIFWDAQPNGAAPTVGDVLDQATITNAVDAPYKRQYQKRFKIVYDKTFVSSPNMADPANATTQVLQKITWKKAKKALNRMVKYRNAQNTGVITDLATNSLYSLWVTSNSQGQLTCGYRMYFKDT